jgi:outer membrane receptor protein involved in Fe transport
MQHTCDRLFVRFHRTIPVCSICAFVLSAGLSVSAQSLGPMLADNTATATPPPSVGDAPAGKSTVAGGTQQSGQKTQSPTTEASTTVPAQMQEVTVVGKLDQQRQEIVPSLGATVYTIDQQEIQDLTQGNNIPFSKLVLRFPGVSQDSEGSGSFHVRDEHANVQYRINDVLIPEGITSFGSQFDTRFADHVDLITGALPAQYGFRESGILDIHTKSGAFDQGGEAEMYGGSQGTIHPSFEYGGQQGKLNYYFSGNYLQDDLGIENPTASTNAIHDSTDQYRGFAYLSYIIDDSSRISLIAGEAYNQFEIPNSPNQQPAVDGTGAPFTIPGAATFDSTQLNERQREQNNFEVLAYQKSTDDFDFQASIFNSYSSVVFEPDQLGDLYFNGVAGGLNRSVMTYGYQFDSAWRVTDDHTIRGGVLVEAQGASQVANTTVIPEDGTGAQDGTPETFNNTDYSTAYSYGLYLQDEWKVTKQLTLNYGGRMDFYQSTQIRQNQLSPRVNAVFTLDKNTSFHGGYASYFTPPPLENIPQGADQEFAGTSNAPSTDAAGNPLPNDPVKSERANYFDIGATHNFTPEYQVGLDAYYKTSTNTLDDGQFGAAPILSAFNYAKGQITGVELSQNYTTKAGFSAYGNLAVEKGIGTQVNSAQSVLFSADDYNYISNHYIYLDHSQTFTGSAGVTYNISQTETRPYVELVCGSGLRTDTDTVPNGASVPAYDSVNIGFTQGFKWAGVPNLTARFDCTNVADQVYVLRDGAGVGVFAPQYGARRAFYGGLSYSF